MDANARLCDVCDGDGLVVEAVIDHATGLVDSREEPCLACSAAVPPQQWQRSDVRRGAVARLGLMVPARR